MSVSVTTEYRYIRSNVGKLIHSVDLMSVSETTEYRYMRSNVEKLVHHSPLSGFRIKLNWYPMKPNSMIRNAADHMWEIPFFLKLHLSQRLLDENAMTVMRKA